MTAPTDLVGDAIHVVQRLRARHLHCCPERGANHAENCADVFEIDQFLDRVNGQPAVTPELVALREAASQVYRATSELLQLDPEVYGSAYLKGVRKVCWTVADIYGWH